MACHIPLNFVRGEPAVRRRWTGWVRDFRRITHHFRGIYRIYLKWIKQIRKISTCNQLNLESLGSWPTLYTQTLPWHWHWNVGARLRRLFRMSTTSRNSKVKLGVKKTRAPWIYANAFTCGWAKYRHITLLTLSLYIGHEQVYALPTWERRGPTAQTSFRLVGSYHCVWRPFLVQFPKI